ncbi:hypothetical protein BH23CHL5_BH23CHL5_27450 [soil metagenome]
MCCFSKPNYARKTDRLRNSARSVQLLLALVLLLSGALHTSPATAASPSLFYVESSGHTLGDPFLSYWIDNEGHSILGDPVTEIVIQSSRAVQYFEFGALIIQYGGSVGRAKVAEELMQVRHSPDQTTSGLRRIASNPKPGAPVSAIIPLDDHDQTPIPIFSVASSLQSFYREMGGRSVIGKPLSNAVRVGERTEQWFEYARIETVNGIAQLAPVGLELAWSLGLDTSAAVPGDAPLFDTNRFRKFTGDGTIRNSTRPFIPTRISIPKLRIDAVIESVGVDNGVMGVPINEWNVGWYPTYAAPGEFTNVVMAGHRDWWNVGPVVFWNLHLLQPGDKIYVTGPDGAGATYVVTLGWLVDATIDARLLTDDVGKEVLTLITCGGVWNGREYTSRYVIRAERI